MCSSPSPNGTDRVLLTGGTSYLGRSLVGRLLGEGADVHVIVRPGSDRTRLEGLRGAPVVHEHDGSVECLSEIVAKAAPSTVFHLATRYLREHSPDQIDGLVNDNIGFGTQVLEAMRVAGARRLIDLGTFFQFYDSPTYRPLNLYAATKQAFADIVAYYQDAHGFSAATLVLYDVYGPGDWRAKLMAAIRDAQAGHTTLKLADANVVMDLVYIDDVVDALLHAAREGIEGGPFAISGSQRATLGEIVQVFERVNGTPITSQPGAYPVPARAPNEPWIGPALPGWQAKVGLEEGIRRFLAGET
ncbi:MAG: NAD(P)-dependent oxidoreductase [Rhodospirillales bacterium]|nr:NAD(P)-dependent oxidoreductase [Rhodospirillales bacterium]